jgi:hypothetical protein
MRVAAVMQQHMQVALSARRERREEFVDELAVEVADPFAFEASDLPHERRAAREIDGDRDKHLVHRQRGRPVADDAGPIAERLQEGITEHEADVLDRVMRVDLDVAGGVDLEIEHSVLRDGVEHVGQERHRRVDAALTGAIDLEVDADLRLLRVALELLPTRHVFLYQLACDRTTRPMKRSLVVVLAVLVGCGGGGTKKTPKKPTHDLDDTAVKTGPKPDTAADRERKRHEAALAIVPEGSACLPVALKEDGAPRLELGAQGKDAVLCAIDHDANRLLGAVGCWKIDLVEGKLAYAADITQVPGRGMRVPLEAQCARGYCIPKEAKVENKDALIAWSLDGKKVAVLAGEDVHLFDAESKEHESSFSIRGDKGVTNDAIGLYFIDGHVLVEGADQGPYSAVWLFKTDGTQMGPLVGLGGKDPKPMSTYGGSVSILDPEHVAVSERGMETLTSYTLENGARAKAVRKIVKPSCKPDEIDAYWHDGDKVSDKCRESLESQYANLKGATAVMGSKSLLVLLRGERLGELGVMDPKSLAEKRAIKLPWCEK